MSNFNRNNSYQPKSFDKDNNNNYLGKKVKPPNYIKDKFNYNNNKYKNEKINNNNKNYHQYKDNYHHNYHHNYEYKYSQNNENQNNFEDRGKNGYYNYNYNKKPKFDNNIDNNKGNVELPIFNKREEILEKIQKNRVIIVSGNTGCGKSTQVPQFIFDTFKDSQILITQPRRIAAISIARRLSYERDRKLGSLIGYHVSMVQCMSAETKIFVKTTGIFMEELLHNKELEYSYIILDEVHERDLYIDLVLALLKKYFEEFPKSKIKLILMSATIAENDFSKYLNDINRNYNYEVPIIKVKEKWHEVEEFRIERIISKILDSNAVSKELKQSIEDEKSSCISLDYNSPTFSESLFPVVAGIIEKTQKIDKNRRGILIFIPGLGEIQDLHDYLANYFINSKDLEFLILHSQVNDEEQEKVFKINNKRKIILATNIAESSITISNIDFVIDFCLVKQLKFDEDQNTSILELKWCSKASCEQRKGRTGRVARGYYFQLITKELYDKFNDHQEPEILRTPLETPILKLKLYDQNEEPEKILFKTMNPPTQDTTIKTIFRLQKMGALVDVNFDCNEEIMDIEEKNENQKGIKYSSGKITKIGRIFADLPIDIKYSRLIILSYCLGQIDVGISLAAILSQDRSLFLNSNKCNRISLYDSKNIYCNKQNCDFIALYTAYKKWCSQYKNDFINEKIIFDTRLKKASRERYKEIQSYAKKNNLDLKTLREILRVENDLKKRLSLKGFYSKYFEDKPINFTENKSAFILKIILAGTFYNQMFAPEYDNFIAVQNDINRISNNQKQEELYTIRISNISFEEKDKLIEIFQAIIQPGKIVNVVYEEYAEMIMIKFSDIESVRKILFITSSCLRRNKEIPLFKYVEDCNGINNNYSDNKTVYIKLGKEPDYAYSLHFYDLYVGGQIYLDKDSINLTYIIQNYEELKKTIFVTDSYNNKSGNSTKKNARYTSLLPRTKMFDKIIMLTFGPKFEMIASKIENSDKYSQYIGFQSFEYTGPNYFDYDLDLDKPPRNRIVKTNFIKLDYLLTNYHLLTINEIRNMINEMIEPKFFLNDEVKDEEKNKKEFEEKKDLYTKRASEILSKIKDLVDTPKIKYISENIYIKLSKYIDEFKRKFKKPKNKNSQVQHSKEENELKNEESEEDDDVEMVDQKDENIYLGYINEIKKLKNKEEDFLQFHQPLEIVEEYYHNQFKRKKLLNNEKKLSRIYDDYNEVLNRIKSLAFNKEAWLCCPSCDAEICSIKEGSPKITERKNIGEHIIEGAWITSSLKSFKENKDKIKKEQEEEFKESLKKNRINYDNLFCCPSGESIIGYIYKDKRYIFCGSKLFVKYPDLNIGIINEEDYKNDFKNIHNKVKQILIEKETDEFKKMICCKLCGFTVEKDVKDFKTHLNKKEHKEKMEELKKEFLF